MVIDSSVLLNALFPDEMQPQAQAVIRDYVADYFPLKAPALLAYELTNAIWQGVRRKRITQAQARVMLQTADSLQIELEPVTWGEMLHWMAQYDRSAYDAAYLALAYRLQMPLVTGDKRLYNAVSKDVDWIIWVGDYKPLTQF